MFSAILESLWPLNTARDVMETAAQGVLTRDEMESRRLLAAQDLQNGQSQSQIAKKFGVSRTTASRWHRAWHVRGADALRKRRATGRPSRLTAEQQCAVAEIYHAGPRAAGFNSAVWTTSRLAEAIRARFGIRYDPDHVGRIMHRLGLRARMRTRRRGMAAGMTAAAGSGATIANMPDPDYGSRYSPNTAFSRPEISPTVA